MSDYEFVLSSGETVPVVITVRRGLRNITLRRHRRRLRCVFWNKNVAGVNAYLTMRHKKYDCILVMK